MKGPYFSEPLLAIETSCDETSAALLEGSTVIRNVVMSQVEMHNKWGGIVPEAAARAHVEAILPVLIEALGNKEIGAIAVTNRPGLVGALSVGVTAAKALSLVREIPIIGVHHLEGHIWSLLTNSGKSHPCLENPHLSLIVSGGHTELVHVFEPGKYRILGETLDDAAGEAFDKAARLLGLGYPGGKAIEELAQNGDPHRYKLPRGLARDPLNFSFSGLKTAVLRLVESEGESLCKEDAAASLQEAIVDALAKKVEFALQNFGRKYLSLVGGVAANRSLRERLSFVAHRNGTEFLTPDFEFCTDNAAMIGLAGSLRLAKGEYSGFELESMPNSPLPGLID